MGEVRWSGWGGDAGVGELRRRQAGGVGGGYLLCDGEGIIVEALGEPHASLADEFVGGVLHHRMALVLSTRHGKLAALAAYCLTERCESKVRILIDALRGAHHTVAIAPVRGAGDLQLRGRRVRRGWVKEARAGRREEGRER